MRRFLGAFATLLLVLLPAAAAQAQDQSRRLILKDGSYQLVTKYEVKGGRVRYFSSEREEWEELPDSLVDWPATEKFEKDRAERAAAPEAVKLDKELEHDREMEEAERPQVAPGLHLPEDSGVFMLDSFQGEAQVVEIQQNTGDIGHNTKGNILRAAVNPLASVKANIELAGAHAAVQSHVGVPTLYVNIDPASEEMVRPGTGRAEPQSPQQPQQAEQPQQPFDRFRIVHADVKNGKRVLGDVKRAINGKISQEQHFVKTTANRIKGGWIAVTPTEPLAPGEYALAETLGAEGMNLYVWDFGVNPKAPANANPWKAEVKPGTTDKLK